MQADILDSALRTGNLRLVKILVQFSLCAILSAASPAHGEIRAAGNPDELRAAVRDAHPGDEIVIEDGVWRDVDVRIAGKGSAKAPIRIRPATPGGLRITGRSRIRIGGEHLVISGLHLRDITEESDWLQFREDSKNLARHCRLTDCVFDESEEFDGETESRWVGIYGENNEFDHCRVEGKTTRGTSVVVWLQEGLEARHRIHHNVFGDRQPLGRNGGETLRIGDSKTSLLSARCVIEDNLFERCNGEAECISNKSCENIYRRNLFREVQGTLSLRHGHRCRVERNVFLGNDLKETGGIRIIGEDHVVIGNYLARLGGDDSRGALVLQNGIPDSPLNGYAPVRRVLIEDNHVFACRQSLVIGYADEDSPASTVAPEDCIFRGNAFLAGPKDTVVFSHHAAKNTQWKSNRATGKALGMDPVTGFEFRPGAALPSEETLPPHPDVLESVRSAGPTW